MRAMRKTAACVSLVLLTYLSGCGRHAISDKLSDIDSLVMAEQYDSAYHMVEAIDESRVKEGEDRAHYLLLKVQTSYLKNNTFLPDNSLQQALAYYQKNKDAVKLANCYYYLATQLYRQKDFQQSMTYYKKAEKEAKKTEQALLLYKIIDAIALLNSRCANYHQSLDYAKKSLIYAGQSGRDYLKAYAYYRMGLAYFNLEKEDSAIFSFDMTAPYINKLREEDRPYFLSNLSLVYFDEKPDVSKKYLEESLTYKELASTLELLAEITNEEGNHEEAYQLWKRALAVDDLAPKDDIIHNLLEYDIKHGSTDKVCERVNEIIAIKDSVITKLKNDTIKDLQVRFDHEVELGAAKDRLIRWQMGLGIPAILFLVLTVVWVMRQSRTAKRLREREIEIKNKIVLLSAKEKQVDDCQKQIAFLEKQQAEGIQKVAEQSAEIESLKAEKEKADMACRELNRIIGQWAGAEAEKVRMGTLLMEDVEKNMSLRHWSDEKREAFVAYYCALHPKLAARIKFEHSLFSSKETLYLILEDMGKSKEEMSEILGVDKDTLRTYKFRVKKKEGVERH